MSQQTLDVRTTLAKRRKLTRLQRASFLRIADDVLAEALPALQARERAGEEGPFQDLRLLDLARELEALLAVVAPAVPKKGRAS